VDLHAAAASALCGGVVTSVTGADTENAPHGVKSYAIDPGVAQQLWVASEETVGEGFDLL